MTKRRIATVHIAGPSINIDETTIIQRCAICGFKLYDSRDGEPKLMEGASFNKVGWPMGVYVREVGGRYECQPTERFTNKPNGLCVDLVER